MSTALFAWTGCETDVNGNGGAPAAAGYVGSATCAACHPSFATLTEPGGHAQALKAVDGGPPTYPPDSPVAGVPDPPPGFAWTDVSYLIGGYTKGANFVDADGFVLINDTTGQPLFYHLANPPTATAAGYDPVAPDQISQAPFDYDCFRCHTTGPESFDTNGGMRQQNRAGIGGTWSEDGVHCEACHGPGSKHVPDPPAGNIVIDASNDTCDRCHVGQGDGSAIQAFGGFIVGNQQSLEVDAGPHAGFQCIVCHNPHGSLVADREAAIRNACTDCHSSMNMALHAGRVFVRGDDVEPLSCESCHMSRAGKNASSATTAPLDGTVGRIGDTRTHLVLIDTLERDFTAMFSADGGAVLTGADGRAAVTLDFVCLRCHDGEGSAFALTLDGAGAIADGIHDPP
jgi:hypothetical protein